MVTVRCVFTYALAEVRNESHVKSSLAKTAAAGVLPLLDALARNDAIEQLDLRGNHIHVQNPALEPRFAVIGGGVAVKPRVRLGEDEAMPADTV